MPKVTIITFISFILLFPTYLFGQSQTDSEPPPISMLPQTISYQGALLDTDGEPVPDGTYEMIFSLYEAELEGPPVWTEGQSALVINGVFNVLLGSNVPFTMPFDRQYWLGVAIDEGDELFPRIPLSSTPYSMKARSVEDGAITTEKIAQGAVTQQNIAEGQVVKSINSLHDNISLVAGNNINITPDGNSLEISAAMSNSGNGEYAHTWISPLAADFEGLSYTYISMLNISSTDNDVTVTFYDADGNQAGSEANSTFSPNELWFISTGTGFDSYAGAPSNFTGWVKIQSNNSQPMLVFGSLVFQGPGTTSGFSLTFFPMH